MRKTFLHEKYVSIIVSLVFVTSLLSSALINIPMAMAQEYELVWSDEFDGSSIDTSNWNFEIGGGGWGNNELQYYTSRETNARIESGNLVIEAHEESYGGNNYTSARLTTKGKREFQYGKIEARMKLPMGQGLWPAFWMLGSNIDTVGWPKCGETDIMEHINNETQVHGTIHWDYNGYASYGGSTSVNPTVYNTYTIIWDDQAIKWYLNGNQFLEANITINSTEEFHQPFFMILNLAVGGNWPGPPDASTEFPARVYVDWVRVYQLSGAPPPPDEQAPYDGTPWAIPGKIEAEDYDTGGEGVAYHDSDAGNNGGAYRSEGVDIESCGDTGGGYNVGWIATGEWLEYTVNVGSSGSYDIKVRVATPYSGKSFHIEFDGVNVTESISVPNTGGWQNWTTVTASGVNLSAGQHVMRIAMDTNLFNINYIDIVTEAQGNLALNQPAYASSTESGGLGPEKAVDGTMNTRWSSQFSDPQWIYVDLGASMTIGRVVLKWETAYGKAYKIQVSNDASIWTNVYSTTTGDGGTDDITFDPVTARYVRMYGTQRGTQWGYSLWEFEIYPPTET